MLEVARKYTACGYIILMPHVVKREDAPDDFTRQFMLDDMHKRKIDMSDGILVVGPHRGTSTVSEIEYAYAHGKKIREIL
jgi:hypothetical protein